MTWRARPPRQLRLRQGAGDLGVENVDPYSAQTYDHADLALLAIAAGGEAPARASAERPQGQPGRGRGGRQRLDGLEALAAARAVDYSGASGPCDFDENGDITGTKFRFKRIENGSATGSGGSEPSRRRRARPRPAAPRQRRDGRRAARGTSHRLHCDLRGAALPELRRRLARHHRCLRRLGGECPLGLPAAPALLAAFLVAGAVGLLTDEIALKPLRPAGR